MDFSQIPDMPASDKQRQYIARLIDDLGWHSEQLAEYAHLTDIDLAALTKSQASQLIDRLKNMRGGHV